MYQWICMKVWIWEVEIRKQEFLIEKLELQKSLFDILWNFLPSFEMFLSSSKP